MASQPNLYSSTNKNSKSNFYKIDLHIFTNILIKFIFKKYTFNYMF